MYLNVNSYYVGLVQFNTFVEGVFVTRYILIYFCPSLQTGNSASESY